MAQAKLNKEYALRLIGVGLIMLALCVWSIYDGLVAWPRVNIAMEKVRTELLKGCSNGITPEMWLSSKNEGSSSFRLKDVFDANSVTLPKYLVQELSTITHPDGNSIDARIERANKAAELFNKPIYSEAKLNSQLIQAAITFILALLAFFAVGSKRKTIYIADADGLSGNGFGANAISWETVADVDWSKWDEKGIVTIVTKNGAKIKLDGWHFSGVSAIAEEINARFPHHTNSAN